MDSLKKEIMELKNELEIKGDNKIDELENAMEFVKCEINTLNRQIDSLSKAKRTLQDQNAVLMSNNIKLKEVIYALMQEYVKESWIDKELKQIEENFNVRIREV
jgi:chromosome segregation ATPase